MSYPTRYYLSVQWYANGKTAPHPLATELIAELRSASDGAEFSLEENGVPSGNEGSWYDHTEDLRRLSANHSGVLFTLHGEGHSSGDVWNKYYLNGKCQIEQAVLQIAPFDPKKLV